VIPPMLPPAMAAPNATAGCSCRVLDEIFGLRNTFSTCWYAVKKMTRTRASNGWPTTATSSGSDMAM